MIISIREAFLGREQQKTWGKPVSEWVTITSKGKWTNDVKHIVRSPIIYADGSFGGFSYPLNFGIDINPSCVYARGSVKHTIPPSKVHGIGERVYFYNAEYDCMLNAWVSDGEEAAIREIMDKLSKPIEAKGLSLFALGEQIPLEELLKL